MIRILPLFLVIWMCRRRMNKMTVDGVAFMEIAPGVLISKDTKT